MSDPWLAYAELGESDSEQSEAPGSAAGSGQADQPHGMEVDEAGAPDVHDGDLAGAAPSLAIVVWRPPEARAFGAVTSGEVASLQRPAGVFAHFPLQRCVDEVALLTTRASEADPRTAALQEHLFGKAVVHVESKVALGEKLSIDPRDVERSLGRLSACLLHCDRSFHARFVQSVLAHSVRPLLFVELCRYDATPMAVGVRQQLDEVLRHAGLSDGIAQRDASTGEAVQPAAGAVTIGKTSTRSHVMDSEHQYAILVQTGPPDDLKCVAFVGHHLAWLQVLDRSTAEAERRAILETSGTPLDASRFEMRVRVSTTDAASTNIVVERTISQERRGEWFGLHFECLVHKVSNDHSRVFQLVDRSISGMVNLSLSSPSSS